MSSVDVEILRARLREELDRFGSIAEAARRIGDEDSLSLRDVCNGRKRLTAELLAKLVAVGVDASYVLTGVRQTPLNEPTEREREVLGARGIGWGPATVDVTPLGLCWLLNFRAQEGQGKPLLWGRTLLTALTEFAPKQQRALHLQAVTLQARDKAWPTLMMYLDANPPAVPWAMSPRMGVAEEYDFGLGEHDLPIELPDNGFPEPVLRLDAKEVKALLAGKVLSFGAADATHTATAPGDAAAPSERQRASESYKAKVSKSFFSFAIGKVER